MDKIRESFARYFEHFGIQLPDPVPARGQISQAGWGITYIVSPDEQGNSCLEFVAYHRMTNARHVQIKSDGEMVSLPMFEQDYSYDANVPGDREAAEARMKAQNDAVLADLKKKGLVG